MTTSGTGRNRAFTLIEILMAFAILATTVTLVSTLLSRHLHVLRLLSGAVTAYHVADQQLIREVLNREKLFPFSSEQTEHGFVPQKNLVSFHFDQDPLKGCEMDDVTVNVSWDVRGRTRSSQMRAGFQPEN